MPDTAFGFVTMAHDTASLRRARALARSLRRHEPGARIALLAVGALGPSPAEFDEAVPLPSVEPFSGPYRFFNKLVAIAVHSPFRRNLFLDDDVLAVGPPSPAVNESFRGLPFALNCDRKGPIEPFSGPNHVDPAAVAGEFGIADVLDPYGGGHLYFERPACDPFFREAISEALFAPERYARLSGDGFLSDETALAIVANRHRLALPSLDGWIDPLDRARAETIELDLEAGIYRFPGRERGADDRTRLLHFCADGKSSGVYRSAVTSLLGEPEPSLSGGGLLGRLAAKLMGR